jgi:putative restriction endonuclease
LVSPVVHRQSLARMGIDPDFSLNVGSFSSGQKKHLEFHREDVLLWSRFIKR